MQVMSDDVWVWIRKIKSKYHRVGGPCWRRKECIFRFELTLRSFWTDCPSWPCSFCSSRWPWWGSSSTWPILVHTCSRRLLFFFCARVFGLWKDLLTRRWLLDLLCCFSLRRSDLILLPMFYGPIWDFIIFLFVVWRVRLIAMFLVLVRNFCWVLCWRFFWRDCGLCLRELIFP